MSALHECALHCKNDGDDWRHFFAVLCIHWDMLHGVAAHLQELNSKLFRIRIRKMDMYFTGAGDLLAALLLVSLRTMSTTDIPN